MWNSGESESKDARRRARDGRMSAREEEKGEASTRTRREREMRKKRD